jgi:hypothetical protein
MRQCFEPLALLAAQPNYLNYVFLDRNLFPGHESPPPLHRGGRDSEKHHSFKDAGD